MVTNLLHKPLLHRLGALGRLPQPARKAIQEADRGRRVLHGDALTVRDDYRIRALEVPSEPAAGRAGVTPAERAKPLLSDGRGGMLKSGIRKFEVCGVWTKTERGRQHVDAEISGWAPGE